MSQHGDAENVDNWALIQYEWVVEGVLMGIVGVLGICGNISAIAIFWARFYKKSGHTFHHLMMALSVFDLIYILMSLYIFALPQMVDHFKG